MKWCLRWLKRILVILLVLCTSISLVLYLFEDKIIRKVVAQANTYLKVPVTVDQIQVHFWRTFPRISVAFERVQIADPLQKKDTLLAAEQISLRFNPFDLLSGSYHIQQISIANGAARLHQNAAGQTNYDIFKTDSTASSDFDLELKAVLLEQIQVQYRGPNNSYLMSATVHSAELSGQFSAAKTTLSASADIQLKRIQKEKIPVLKNQPLQFDLDVLVDHTQNSMELPQAQIRLAHLPFLLDAQSGPSATSFDLRSEALGLKAFLSAVSPAQSKALAKLKADGLVNFQLHYQSKLGEATQIAAYFGIQNGELIEPKFGTKVRNLQCIGSYKNLPTELLQVTRFQFDTQGAHFDGQLQLQDFAQPKLKLQANGDIPLAMIQALYPLPAVQAAHGQLKVNLKTQLQANLAQEWQLLELAGKANLRSSQLQLEDLQKPFKAVSARFMFSKEAITITDLKAQIGRSDVHINARAQMPTLAKRTPFMLSGVLHSTNLVQDDFQTKPSTQTAQQTNQSASAWFLPTNLQLSMPFEVQSCIFEQKKFEDLSGTLQIDSRRCSFQGLRGLHAAGKWKGALQIEEHAPSNLSIRARGSVQHLNLKKFFAQWQNFDQTMLTSEQLSGTGQMEFDVSTNYHLDKGLNEASLQAKVKCQIDAGHLYHAPILQDLANTLTTGKGRPIFGAKNQAALRQKLQDVRFETLSNTFIISDRKLCFDKMHIASDALDIDLVGQHTFDHYIDYAVALRLRDLVVQETETEFGEILDDGTGLRLFVRCVGELDDPKVTWDKKGKKEMAKQRFEESQAESKAMLKTAFGLYQNDPTVGAYQEKSTPHETIRMNFEPDQKTVKTDKKEQKAPRNSKLQQQLNKWKQEQQPASEVKVKIGA